jgi:hypothetical protein
MAGEYRAALLEHVGIASGAVETSDLQQIRRDLEDVASLLLGPVLDPEPSIREAWPSMTCRGEDPALVPRTPADLYAPGHCRCPLCQWEARNRPRVEEWNRGHQIRPHRKYAHPFGSLGAALEAYLLHREDPQGAKSSMGSIADRAEESGKLGTTVQTTRRARDSAEIRQADRALDVERCIAVACADPHVRGELSAREAAEVLLRSADARHPLDAEVYAERWGVTANTIRGVVKRSRKRVKVELAARDQIPEPRLSEGLLPEIARRRKELGT